MKILRRKNEEIDEDEEETQPLEIPKPKLPKQEPQEQEEKHTAGQIEAIVDVVGLRVWKNDKEYVDFPLEQRWAAELASVIFKEVAE